jgi:LEA14-like dessication related protein
MKIRQVQAMNNERKNKKYHTIGTASNSKIKIIERDNIDNPNTHILPLRYVYRYMAAHFPCMLQAFNSKK